MFRLLLVPLLMLCGQPAYAEVMINLRSPQDGEQYTAPASVTVDSFARAIYDGEVITAHRLYRDGVEIASGTTGTLSTTITLTAGTYQFQSGANSNQGGGAASEMHTITVVEPGGDPPTVTLGTPTGTPFIAPATVGLLATAADSDGTIVKVEFFDNGGLIGTDTVAPYQVTWSDVAAGSHSVTAQATDNNDVTTTSTAQTVVVNASVVKGYVDGLVMNAGTYEIKGWACSTGRDGSIPVDLYTGGEAGVGTFVGRYTADQASESAVAAACQAHGAYYRFRIPLSDAVRQQHANKKIYIHGLGEGPNLLLQRSGVFIIPAPQVSARHYIYDTYQRLCKTVEPETGTTLYEYDDAGNLIEQTVGLAAAAPDSCTDTTSMTSASSSVTSSTDAPPTGGTNPPTQSRTITRTYDARNRLLSVMFPDHRGDTTYRYTPDSQLASITADNGGTARVTTQYRYNNRGLLEEERMLWNNIDWPINYTYDANGHLASQRSTVGLVVDYVPNALGQPTRAGSYATNVSYYPNGAIKQFTYGNGIVHTMTQNTRQLPERSQDVYGGTVILDDSYDYDSNGNVLAISDALPDHNGDRSMVYDDLDRLTGVTWDTYGTQASYAYDGLDNLTHVRAPDGRDHFYCYDSRWHLTNVKNGGCDTGTTVIGLGYDEQGNLANKNGQIFDFDYGNRLRSVSGSPSSSYVYDGHGRRVRDYTTASKYSQYSHTGQLVFANDVRQNKWLDHVYLGGSLVAIRERDRATGVYTTKYQHTDALGSPVAVTDQARTVLERREYEPYGRQLRPAALADGSGYTGHVLDAATGLNYMQQRYYDPFLQRFVSVDPIAANANTGENFCRYCYANNNPYKFTDPDGRFAHIIAGGVIGGVISGGIELYKQARTGEFDGKALAIETGKGVVVGAVTAAVPVGIAAGALNFGSKAANVAAVAGTAVAAGAGGEAAAQLAKGGQVNATQAAIAGAANLAGVAAGSAIAAPAKAVSTVTTEAIPGAAVQSLSGRTFTIGAVPAASSTSAVQAQAIQDAVGETVSSAAQQAVNRRLEIDR